MSVRFPFSGVGHLTPRKAAACAAFFVNTRAIHKTASHPPRRPSQESSSELVSNIEPTLIHHYLKHFLLFHLPGTFDTYLRPHDPTSEPPSLSPRTTVTNQRSSTTLPLIQHGRQGVPRTRQLLLLVLLQGCRLWHARLLPQHRALRLMPVLKKATGTCILQLRPGPVLPPNWAGCIRRRHVRSMQAAPRRS
jgi:hypothetical protein